MRLEGILPIVFAIGVVNTAVGQTTTYRPLGSWTDPASEAYSRWEGDLQEKVARAKPVRAEARPQFAGLRPKSAELLEDGLLRKQKGKLRNDPRLARRAISDLYRRPRYGRNVLNGTMAEAIFLDRNQEWGYVGRPNAPQHDVYRWVNGRRTPLNGQVKYHDSGDPSRYARDMVGDHRAHRFFIPDDHVEPTKAYLKAEALRLEATGDRLGAAQRWRDYGRVRPIGGTAAEIRAATGEAARSVTRERYATYTSLGATLVLAAGMPIYDWARGDLPANMAAYRTVRSLSLLGVSVGGDLALRHIGRGALRGTVRGNAIIGTALAITETAWLLHEHGWGRAFYQPEFYEQVGGSVSALALGLAGGTYATGLAVETGPWAPVIGAGVGLVTGTVGYLGGKTIARAMIEILSPEMLRREERHRIGSVKASLDRQIARLQEY
jgi:hypothetical protein